MMRELDETSLHWFCLRAKAKQEHIAAMNLGRELQVYLPRIRFRRATRRGPVFFTEALFPSYLFARLNLAQHLRFTKHARGVQGIVHFGDRWPTIREEVIDALRNVIQHGAVHEVEPLLTPGQEVEVCGGFFHGFEAVITRVMPASERVALLMEYLGGQAQVELPAHHVLSAKAGRERAWLKV